MAITVKNNLFTIETKNTAYQMEADSYGVLKHLWYGEKTDCDMSYLICYRGAGFSGNIYDAGHDRSYSLDLLPLEYSCDGIGDYRISATAVTHANGSSALDLRFVDYKITQGKYSIPALPAVYADESQAQTLEITLKDIASEVYVTLKYGVLEELDIITRSAVFRNGGKEAVTLTKAASLCLDFPQGDLELIHFHGRHNMERMYERAPLIHGIQEIASTRGASSHQHNPAIMLCSPDCTEASGECFGAALVYSGAFQTKIELDQMNKARLVMGLHPDLFRWKLSCGEEFYTPEVILSYSACGTARLSQNFHKVIREHVCRGEYKLAQRPVLINNWEATYFDFNEEKLYDIAQKARELGVDMLVMDDGWFGKREGDISGLGDWFVNESKLKGGLEKLTKRITALGMKFGIWFEPEMVSEDSDLYRAHPDWSIQIPNRAPNRSRFQLLLDMSREDVRQYLYERMSDILSSADISYVKWDMNRSICDWYSALLPAERQGEMPHRYMLGLYDLLERLTHDFPHVLFEGCSGGGGRYDAGMMYYCPQIWCSDDTDAYERTKIQYGSSFFYPISTVGSHVSAVPNHQTGRITSLDARKTVAMAGSFGYEMDLGLLSDEEKEIVKNQIIEYKKHRGLIHGGEYYRLSNPQVENFAAWSFVAKDGREALIQGLIFRSETNMFPYRLKLSGLCPDKKYTLDGTTYSGKALMSGGIILPQIWGDNCPFTFYITETE